MPSVYGWCQAAGPAVYNSRPMDEGAPRLQGLLRGRLAGAIHEAMRNTGFSVARFPHVTLSADPTLRIGEARAIAWHSRDPLSSIPSAGEDADEPLTGPAVGAFLIVDGKRHFRLDRPLITIGRKLDHHLVLPDPRVSRRHAEIRLQGRRYMLRDFHSPSGTRVKCAV